MIEIIAAIAAVVAAVAGAFVGSLWGRMRGEADGRATALQDVERAQRKAYQDTRERMDHAPRTSDADNARDSLRSRRDDQ